jgi:hypothetical protein
MAFVAMRRALAGLPKPVLQACANRTARQFHLNLSGHRHRAATRQGRSLLTGHHQGADAAALRRFEDSSMEQFPTLVTRQLSQRASNAAVAAAGAPTTAAEVGLLLKQLRAFLVNRFSGAPPRGFGRFAKEQPQGKGNGGGGGAKGEPPANKPEGGGAGGAGESAKKSSTAAGEAAAAEGEGAAQQGGGAAAGAEGEAAAASAGKAGAEGEAASSSSAGSNSAKKTGEEAGGGAGGAGAAGGGDKGEKAKKAFENEFKKKKAKASRGGFGGSEQPAGSGGPDDVPELVKNFGVVVAALLASGLMLSSMSKEPDQDGRTVSWQEFQNEYLQRGLVDRIVVYNKAVAIADLRADAGENVGDGVRCIMVVFYWRLVFVSTGSVFLSPSAARARRACMQHARWLACKRLAVRKKRKKKVMCVCACVAGWCSDGGDWWRLGCACA